MSARHLRNMRVRLDPNDHGYHAEPRAETGEIEIDRAYDQDTFEVDYDQRPRRSAAPILLAHVRLQVAKARRARR